MSEEFEAKLWLSVYGARYVVAMRERDLPAYAHEKAVGAADEALRTFNDFLRKGKPDSPFLRKVLGIVA